MLSDAVNRLLAHPGALCNMVRRVAVEAGDVTLDYFDEAGFVGAEEKGDGSPVTQADRAAEAVIERALADITPGVPMVGEEAVAEGRIPDLAGAEYFWLVDPLDGTKEFIGGSGDYTVNIALIRGDAPVLGVVYAPVPGELYAGHGAGTAVRWLADSGNDKPIQVRRPPAEGLTVVASASHGDQQKLDEFLQGYKIAKVLKRGSSLKICSIASGKADIYPRFGPTCEWDIAAGDAVLRAAGGVLTDLQGRDMTYRKTQDGLTNGAFVACSADLKPGDQL